MSDFDFKDRTDLRPKSNDTQDNGDKAADFNQSNYFNPSDNNERTNAPENPAGRTSLLQETQDAGTNTSFKRAQDNIKPQQNGQSDAYSPIYLYEKPPAVTKDTNSDVSIQPVADKAGDKTSPQREKPESQKVATKSGREFETNKKVNSYDYTVKPKDTMWSIAKDVLTQANPDHKPTAKEIMTAVKEIAKNSHISDPTLIKPGQKIHVPEHYFKGKDTQRKAEAPVKDSPNQSKTQDNPVQSSKRASASPGDIPPPQQSTDTQAKPVDNPVQSSERTNPGTDAVASPQKISDTNPNSPATLPQADTQSSEPPKTASDTNIADTSPQQTTDLKTQDITPVSRELLNAPNSTKADVSDPAPSKNAPADLKPAPVENTKSSDEKQTLPDTALAAPDISEISHILKDPHYPLQVFKNVEERLAAARKDDFLRTEPGEQPKLGSMGEVKTEVYKSGDAIWTFPDGTVKVLGGKGDQYAHHAYNPDGSENKMVDYSKINPNASYQTVWRKGIDGSTHESFFDDAGKPAGEKFIYRDGQSTTYDAQGKKIESQIASNEKPKE
jgi:hypothetical protein